MTIKTLTLLAAAICCQYTAMANPVTSSQARGKALSFLKEHGKSAQTLRAMPLPQIAKANGEVPYHVFNCSEGQGFVVVAGDDIAGDILAYSDHGTMDPASLPAPVKALLDGYATEMRQARAASHRVAAAASAGTTASQVIAPLLETQWGQSSPYNTLCLTAQGKSAVTGYVATALAQVLYFYHASVGATTDIPGYTTAKGDTYDALPSTTFDWGKIRKRYGDNDTEVQRNAVAKLMLYAGRAMETAYGTNTSTAKLEACANALNQYFGFENPAVMVSRDQCGVEEWNALIDHELQEGRPVIYSAENGLTSSHAFVCDGADGNGLYHINWCQDGTYDGYYRLSAINLASHSTANNTTAYGYSINHKAVLGIHPTTVTDTYGQPTGDAPTATYADLEVTSLEQVFGDTSRKILRVVIHNNGTRDFAGMLRLQLQGSFVSSENFYVAAGGEDFVDFLFSKAAGTYTLKVIDKKSGQVIEQQDAFTLVDAPELSQPTIVSCQALTVNQATRTQMGGVCDISVSLSNSGTTGYFGDMTLKVNILDEESTGFLITRTVTVTQHVSLNAREWKTFIISSPELKIGSSFYYTVTVGSATARGADAFNPYLVVAGASYWDAGGVRRAVALGDNTIVPENAVAVSFEEIDMDDKAVTPNSNPNTIYYFDEGTTVPAALQQHNVVCGGVAQGNITLLDGYNYYVPSSFMVDGEVAYVRSFQQGGDGRKGWHTIVLPFDVEKVTVDGKQVDWCHANNGRSYDFWLCELTAMDDGEMRVKAADEWQACKPYLIAVPDSRWEERFNLCDKDMVFTASQVRMSKTTSSATIYGDYSFMGSTSTLQPSGLVMNDDGTAFVAVDSDDEDNATVKPFHAYMKKKGGVQESESLAIVNTSIIPGDTTNDGKTTVTDITTVVNHILGFPSNSFLPYLGDMDKSNTLTIVDVTTIVDIILGQ